MRRLLGWGHPRMLAYELRMCPDPRGDDPEGRAVSDGWSRYQVTEEDWVQRSEILGPEDLRSADRILTFRDRGSALDLLHHLAADSLCRQALRGALGEVSLSGPLIRMRDREVLDQLAWRLVAGSLRIAVRLGPRPTCARSSAAPPAPPAPPPGVTYLAPPREEPPPPGAPPAPDGDPPLPEWMDLRKLVAVMRRAARDGYPYCEECAKAGRSQEPASAQGAF
jgi:hypothetical protein